MQDIAIDDPRIDVAGAFGTAAGFNGGTVYRRLPDTISHQLPAEVDQMASFPSGVRLRFVTDASMIGLECNPMIIQFGDEDPIPATIDLVIDGEVYDSSGTVNGTRVRLQRDNRTSIELIAGDNVSMVVSNPASEPRLVELWLPQAAITECFAVRIGDNDTLAAPPADTRRRWVHHGSSISHAMEAHGPARAWPAVAARAADWSITNLGLAGQAHLDQFTARAIRDRPADLITLKLGINVVNGDTIRERAFGPALHGFLDTIRDGHPSTPIVLISPIWCPPHEEVHGPSIPDDGVMTSKRSTRAENCGALTLQRIRAIESELVERRRIFGDEHLYYVDGLRLFSDADADMLPDLLHPDGDGQQLMGERAVELLADWLR